MEAPLFIQENGIIKMELSRCRTTDPNARPIIYTDLRLQDGILTAIYQDGDLSQILTWQKLSN